MRSIISLCVAAALVACGLPSASLAQAAQPGAGGAGGNTSASTVTCKAGAGCVSLPVKLPTVNGSVNVQALLLPYSMAKNIFGKRVAQVYAPIVLNINNTSPDAALLVQSIFIDYSEWALAGCTKPPVGDPNKTAVAAQDDVPAGQSGKPTAPVSAPSASPRFSANKASSERCEVVSAEERVVRQTLLDAQRWGWRAQLMRYLVFGGAVAAGLTWTAGSRTNFPKVVSTFTGTIIPALDTAIPDPYIDQLNLLGDLAFRVNSTVPKENSTILVAFFPIRRFLTAPLAKIFQDDPAMFFTPNLWTLGGWDKKSAKERDEMQAILVEA